MMRVLSGDTAALAAKLAPARHKIPFVITFIFIVFILN
jgi:hypothetical protein